VSRDVPRRPGDRLADRSGAGAPAPLAQSTHPALIAVAIAGVVLAGCGGGASTSTVSSTGEGLGPNSAHTAGSDSRSPNGEDLTAANRRELRQIQRQLKPPSRDELLRNEVRLVLTSTNPLACHPPFVTRRFLDAAYGGHQGCVRSRTPGSVARHVDFRRLQVTGDHASAVVVATGGPNDGERITVSMIRDPRWSVDRLRSNVPVGP
jgi:hypothetical protein